MLNLAELAVPIIAAPMAGGPSTPALVSALAQAGALGFLAGGYLTPETYIAQTMQARESGLPFGTNLFITPEEQLTAQEESALADYRALLAPLAQRYGVEVGPAQQSDDWWDAKSEHLLRNPVPAVSFTFGVPQREFIRDMHRAGTLTLATITSVAEARQAADHGVRALIVQGPEAGGHRGTWQVRAEPEEVPLLDLLAQVRSEVDLPLVAAGGLATGQQIRQALAAGAVAVQVGTPFLLAEEAGTSATVRSALGDRHRTGTATTRAYSGRIARGLRNEFITQFSAAAPAIYPAVNSMTGPIRAAAARAGDAQVTHLWAGTGWAHVRPGSAPEILTRLWSTHDPH